jgi:flagellar biosynthesis protein FlhG
MFARLKPKRSSEVSQVAIITEPTKIRGAKDSKSILIAIGGGKGGVGKSFFSSNLGIFLANMGFNTVIIDLDLGAPNVHTTLGEPPPTKNFHDFLFDHTPKLIDTAVSTQFPKLRLISGANDHHELANMSIQHQSRLMSALCDLEVDFTILDLSAGTHTTTMDFFLMAERHIVTVTPDPTSVENAYRFMKSAFFRKITRNERHLQVDEIIAKIMANPAANGVRVPNDLLNLVIKESPEKGQKLKTMIRELSFDLVLNQCRSPKDVQMAQSIATISRKYFGTSVHLLGHMDYDNAVWTALRKRRPLILEYPNSAVYMQLLGIARDIASPYLRKAAI